MKLNFCSKQSMKSILFSTLFILACGSVYAQSQTIKGIVTADGGLPLPGVTVLVKGTTNGTATDFDGNYEITGNTNDVIVFSFIGYTTQEVTIGSKTTINVTLEENLSQLEEVVVVGYGTQKKKEVTGAVAKVSADEIVKAPVADLGAAIQGKVAGVNIQAASGRPGEASNVQIRGLASINGGQPLYIVDNIPQEGNPNIPPEQIESIDILKDGASAAIYGIRATGGVILITTKKGKSGNMKVDLSTYTGIQNITSGTPLMNTAEQLYNLEVTTEQLGTEPLTFFFQPDALDFDSDFVGDVQNDNAIVQNANLNISGGLQDLTFNFATNYFKQDGVLINSGFNRLSNRITGQFSKGKFKAFATIGITTENRTQEPWALYEYAIGQSPWARPLNSIPSVGQNSVELDVGNEIFYSFLSRQLDNIDERETKSNNIALNLEYEVLKGLKYKLNLGRNEWNYFRKFFQPQYLAFSRNGTYNATASRPQAQLDEDYIFTKRETIEHILNYSTSFGLHNLNVLGVMSYERFKSRTLGVGVIFDENASNDIQTLGAGAEGVKPNSFNINRTLAGKLARIQYNYNQKYLFSASYRRDGSSKFSSENKYGNFYGFSAGWNVHEENWFNIPAINSLKIRGSWAELGYEGVSDYSYQPVIETGINYPFGFDEDLQFGSVQRRYASDIFWETTVSKNIGIELAMFKNRLNITADLYQNDKRDMLLQQRIAPSSGTHQPRAASQFNFININAGNMYNRGIEIAASYKNNFGDLKFNVAGTFTKNTNKVTDLNGIERGYANGRPIQSRGTNIEFTTFLAEGYEAGAFFLFQTDGILKSQEEVDAYTSSLDLSNVSTPQPGDMRYKDANGDGVINDNDRVYSGSGQPEFEAGLNLNLSYKGFDFDVQAYYVGGTEIYNGAKLYAYGAGRHRDLLDMWSPQNPTSDIPTFRQNAFHSNFRAASDYFLEDGSYLRIRTLTLGYSIPNIQEMGLDKARVFLTSTNPFTFTSYTGYDPEVGGDGIFTRGVDSGSYPVTRQFMLGLQLSF